MRNKAEEVFAAGDGGEDGGRKCPREGEKGEGEGLSAGSQTYGKGNAVCCL